MNDWMTIYQVYSLASVPFLTFFWIKSYKSWGHAHKNRKPNPPRFALFSQHFPSSYTEEGAQHLKRHYIYWLKGCAIIVTLIPWAFLVDPAPLP
jgi:hypothetical protein